MLEALVYKKRSQRIMAEDLPSTSVKFSNAAPARKNKQNHWKGFPTFRSHLRMRPVSRRRSRRGLVVGFTFRRTPISRFPLDKNPMPGPLSELQPVKAVNTKGQFFRVSFGENPRFQIQLDKRPLSPGTSREASGVPCLNPRRGLTLLSPVCRDPAAGAYPRAASPGPLPGRGFLPRLQSAGGAGPGGEHG